MARKLRLEYPGAIRYKSLIVDGSGNGYFKTVCDYVHLNPARARLVGGEEKLKSYRWSSYPLYLKARSRLPEWLSVRRLFGEWRIARDNAAGRRELKRGWPGDCGPRRR
jgi:REP-associated tyrosine transposase